MSQFEEKVYPFTTEDIFSYFSKLDFKDKSVFTVGSSGDQVFNAIFCGAREVTLFDINPNVEKFFQQKKEILLTSSLEDVYEKVLHISDVSFCERDEVFSKNEVYKMNGYLSSLDHFEYLKSRLDLVDVHFIQGDIFQGSFSLEHSYDCMILSNILQYVDMFANLNGYSECSKDFIRVHFEEWIRHLNTDGVLQLLYCYCYPANRNMVAKICSALEGYPLSLMVFDKDSDKTDAIVTYVKK